MGIHKPNGRLVWILVTAEPIMTETGEYEVVASFTDIQKQVALEHSLTLDRNHYRMIAENASDVVFHLNDDLTVEWINDTTYDILGWKPQEIIGISALEFVHNEDRELVEKKIEELHLTGQTQVLRIRLQNIAGDYKWVEVTIKYVEDTYGKGYIGNWRDITDEYKEQKHASDYTI